MAPLRLILALLVGSLGQKDAGTCPNDQDALMQIRASTMTNETDMGEMCENLAQPVYSSVSVGGGPFAVALAGGEGPQNQNPPKKFTMCGRAEGNQNGIPSDQPAFCLCQVLSVGTQGFYKGGGPFQNEFPTPVANRDWATITPAQPASSAERCFRSGTLDPDIVTPSGYDFSCVDPTGKTDRAPHRSCTFNHGQSFPANHVQEVPPNTQIVGYCIQEVDTPAARDHNSICRMIETPARCSSSVRTGRMEVAADHHHPQP